MRQPNLCARCGSEDVEVRHRKDVTDFRGLTLHVEGLAETVCRNCGLEWTTPGQQADNQAILKSAYAARRDEVRDREGLLTGDQIAWVLNELELTKAEAASLFGGGPNAFSKYINGDVLQSFAMDRLLRLSLAVGDTGIRYLRQGSEAPLVKNALGYFVAPCVSVVLMQSNTANVPLVSVGGDRSAVFEAAVALAA